MRYIMQKASLGECLFYWRGRGAWWQLFFDMLTHPRFYWRVWSRRTLYYHLGKTSRRFHED